MNYKKAIESMNMFKTNHILKYICLLICIIFAAAGCTSVSDTDPGSDAAPDTSERASDSAEDETLVVARINGEDILLGELINAAKTSEMMFDSVAGLSEKEKREKIYGARMEALNLLVKDKVIQQKIEEFDIALTDEEHKKITRDIDSRIQSIREYVLKTYPDLPESELTETVNSLMKSQGISYDTMLGNLTRAALLDHLYKTVMKDAGFDVSAEDIDAAYQALLLSQKEAFDGDISAFEAAMIADDIIAYRPLDCKRMTQLYLMYDQDVIGMINQLIQYNSQDLADEMLEDQRILMQSKADQAMSMLEDGYDFLLLKEALACNGSYTSSFVTKDTTRFSVEYVNAVKALAQTGDISAPIPADRGVYILRLDELIPAGEVPLDDISERIGKDLSVQLEKEAYAAIQREWIENSEIELFEGNIYVK